MPKGGYLLDTFSVTPAGHPTRQLHHIRSTIYLRFDLCIDSDNIETSSPNDPYYTLNEALIYCEFIKHNIESIWNTYVLGTFSLITDPPILINPSLPIQNYGLNPPFCSSLDILVTEVVVLPLDISVVDIATINRIENGAFRQGECLIDVMRGNSRPNIVLGGNTFNNTGIFYYNYSTISETDLGTAVEGITAGDVYVPITPGFINFPAHEYGHILGLDDRYHPGVAYMHPGSNKENVDDIEQRDYLIRRSISHFTPPIYLTGYYDTTVVGESATEYPSKTVPYYNQPPYNNTSVPYNTDYSIFGHDVGDIHPINTRMQRNPYPTDLLLEMDYFDIDYVTKYGWIHNLMSGGFSPNDPNFPSSPLGVVFSELTYQAIYSASALSSSIDYTDPSENPTLIITKRQIDIIVATFNQIESEFFPKILTKFLFLKNYIPGNDAYFSLEPDLDLNGILDFRSVYQNAGGTFIGIIRDYNNSDDFNNLSKCKIVSDEGYNPSLIASVTGNTINIGIDDVMDFRLSSFTYDAGNLIWKLRDGIEHLDYSACINPTGNASTIELYLVNLIGRDQGALLRAQLAIGGPSIYNAIANISASATDEDVKQTMLFVDSSLITFANSAIGICDSGDNINNTWRNYLTTKHLNDRLIINTAAPTDVDHFEHLIRLELDIREHPLVKIIRDLYVYRIVHDEDADTNGFSSLIGQYQNLNPSIPPAYTEVEDSIKIWSMGAGEGGPGFTYKRTLPNDGFPENVTIFYLKFNIYRNIIQILEIFNDI